CRASRVQATSVPLLVKGEGPTKLAHPLAFREGPCCLPRVRSASAPRTGPIAGLNTLPARSPVNASRAPLPKLAHDSGPAWLAKPSLSETCTLSHRAGLSRHTPTPAVSRAQWPERGTSVGYCASAPLQCSAWISRSLIGWPCPL